MSGEHGFPGIRERLGALGGALQNRFSAGAGDRRARHYPLGDVVMTVRVLLADDHPIVREGLKAVLERQGFKVVGDASDGRAAVRLAQAVREVSRGKLYLGPGVWHWQRLWLPGIRSRSANGRYFN